MSRLRDLKTSRTKYRPFGERAALTVVNEEMGNASFFLLNTGGGREWVSTRKCQKGLRNASKRSAVVRTGTCAEHVEVVLFALAARRTPVEVLKFGVDEQHTRRRLGVFR